MKVSNSPVQGSCPAKPRPSGTAVSAAASVSASAAVPASEPPASQKSSGKGGGLSAPVSSDIFGADSPVLNMVHSILDPIPVVGDIANRICGVLSPAYHEQHEAEQAPPPAQASLAIALSASSTGEEPGVSGYL